MLVAAVCAAGVAVGAQQTSSNPRAAAPQGQSLASTNEKPLIVLGCITRDGQQFIITDTRVQQADLKRNIGRYQLSGDPKMLEEYVNNQAEVTGRFEGDPVAAGVRTFKMDSIQRIAFSCWKNPDGANPPNLR
jgi:hypothetical protein